MILILTGWPGIAPACLREQKAYVMKNFNALVAIIAGLRSEWVAKAKQQAYNKIGTWEAREPRP